MKTDELFYELFKIDPSSLFRLAQLELEGTYTFESITVKSTEKRIDGFCQRIDGTGPNLFVEIQGYPDPKIYWRSLRELATYYEATDDSAPFVLLLIFLDPADDPDTFPFMATRPPHQVIRISLLEGLNAITGNSGILTVLKPLVTAKRAIPEQLQAWKSELDALPLPEARIHHLVELLEYAIRQRLPELSEKEVQAMLHLTPIEETVAGKELIQITEQRAIKQGLQEGRVKGRQEGLSKGELIGEIRALQKILKRPITPLPLLARKGQKTLKALLAELEAALSPTPPLS